MGDLDIYELGTLGYEKALSYQKTLLAGKITGQSPDSLLILQHPPTITIGRKGDTRHLLVRKDYLEKHGISFIHSSRGGDITFHGPGQIVGYPIMDLKDHGTDIRNHMRKIEEVIIRTLSDFGIRSRRTDNATGVWVERSKIASIGIAVKKWVTYHGFALNVCTDLDYFDLILSCGITDVRISSMRSWLGENGEITVDDVSPSLIKNFTEVFGFTGISSKNEQDITNNRQHEQTTADCRRKTE